MNPRKTEIRSIMLDIIAGREATKYEANQQAHLFIGIAEVLDRRADKPRDIHNVFSRDPELECEDKLLAQETFSDLIIERVITIGLDISNLELPFFRVHSEAAARLAQIK